MEKNDGGAAFPVLERSGVDSDEVTHYYVEGGMSLRDFFAAKADVSEYLEKMNNHTAKHFGLPMPDSPNGRDWILWKARMKAMLRYIEADAMLSMRERRLEETLEAQRRYFAADYHNMQLRTFGEQYAAEQSEYDPRTDT